MSYWTVLGEQKIFTPPRENSSASLSLCYFYIPLFVGGGELTDSFISQFFLKVAAEKSTTFHMSKNIWAAQTDLGGKKKAPSWVGREIGRWILEELWEGG